MFNHYIKNFGFLQVNNVKVNNLNLTINNNFIVNVNNDKGFNPDEEQTEESEFDNDVSAVDESGKGSQKIDWDLAEEEEENINSPEAKFLPSKLKTLKLEDIYIYLEDYSKAYKLHHCGTYLEFLIARGATIDKKKLKRINSCKLRLCPYCAWRKSLRVFSNVLSCYNHIVGQDSKNNNFKSTFKFLTLTTENVRGEDLSKEIDNILAGFYRFRKYKAFKNAFKGFVRSLEVVCDREPIITKKMYFGKKHDYFVKRGLGIGDDNPNYLYFNVHIHVLLHTYRLQYKENYLETKDIVKLWKKALRVDYSPVCDIREFRAKSGDTKGREIAEIAKYTVKSGDYLKSEYQDYRNNRKSVTPEFVLDSQVIEFLDCALSGRQLLAYGGTFREAHKVLGLDDEKMTDDELIVAEEYVLKYYFSFKNKFYRRIKR